MQELIEDSGDDSRRQRSASRGREFRQEINKLTAGCPPGHFIAYCLISKESSSGLFFNERLLVLNTHKQELSYCSTVPDLPLTHPSQLPPAKQTIKFKQTQKIEFVPEKVRLGHVLVRWTIKGKPDSWKIIMGSNQVARKFYDLIRECLESDKKDNDKPQPSSKAG